MHSIQPYSEELKVNWIATSQAGLSFTPIMLLDVPSILLAPSAKQKRNWKTRQQYKKKV